MPLRHPVKYVYIGHREQGDKGAVRLQNVLCHCEERTQVTNEAIHRVSREADGLSLRLLDPSGSPRAFSPRDDKV